VKDRMLRVIVHMTVALLAAGFWVAQNVNRTYAEASTRAARVVGTLARASRTHPRPGPRPCGVSRSGQRA
jgi:hypothetical protein